ncbi:hypothetical protein Dform_00775 [Dehalogenimonas formicexedens]|uniref:DUF4382 domain-containing protein n=1 Tax=Dehalogenimonas formicexedens TaxID=1839801 RepID=A0A1P8F6L9_9CHLR|nr:hypothetical protein [Dehalogenimonas formicexedens]APV44127.1 hypothetical protein Dform_00775 [Dehalogenimonas formicexedens]
MKTLVVLCAIIGLMFPVAACQNFERSLAPIQSVSFAISDADPLANLTVNIEYGLPDGCYSFDKTKTVEITGGFDIGVWIKKPANAQACDTVFTIGTTAVDLGKKFSPGNTYTIRVNGEDHSVTIPESGTNPDTVIKPAIITKVEVRIAESFPPQVFIDIQGLLTDSCTTLNGVDTRRQGNVIDITVTTQRPKDAVCAQVISYFSTTVPLGSDFVAGQTYTLRVNGLSQQFNVDRKPNPTTSPTPTTAPPITRPPSSATPPDSILPPTMPVPGGTGVSGTGANSPAVG